jgi:hypothetical protein
MAGALSRMAIRDRAFRLGMGKIYQITLIQAAESLSLASRSLSFPAKPILALRQKEARRGNLEAASAFSAPPRESIFSSNRRNRHAEPRSF